MISSLPKHKCTGCSACASACPRHCISMTADNEGFLYPSIDADKCIGCQLCDRVCPVQKEAPQHPLLAVLGVQNKNDGVRLHSSSGGTFTLLAKCVLDGGGAVFGVHYNEDLDVEHTCITETAKLTQLQGSKYVQSVIGSCFQKAKELLEQDVPVLFSGTPCQIAGFKGYLGRDYPNLLTVDLVCHGVPNAMIYHKYLKELAAEAGEAVQEVRFRDKGNGWLRGKTMFITEHREFAASKREDPYMRLFLNNVLIRPSCADCPFNNKRNLSDLTVADYWGVNKQYPDFDDDKGTTLLLINTAKGEAFFNKIAIQANCISTTFEKACMANTALAGRLPLHAQRAAFFEHLDEHTIREWADLLLGPLPSK